MNRRVCALCDNEFVAAGSQVEYGDLCGECAQLLIFRPQDFERKMAGVIQTREARERVKAWFARHPECGMLDAMWRRLDAAELQREMELCVRSAG